MDLVHLICFSSKSATISSSWGLGFGLRLLGSLAAFWLHSLALLIAVPAAQKFLLLSKEYPRGRPIQSWLASSSSCWVVAGHPFTLGSINCIDVVKHLSLQLNCIDKAFLHSSSSFSSRSGLLHLNLVENVKECLQNSPLVIFWRVNRTQGPLGSDLDPEKEGFCTNISLPRVLKHHTFLKSRQKCGKNLGSGILIFGPWLEGKFMKFWLF